MQSWLLYLAAVNVAICAMVGIPLCLGLRTIRKLSDFEPDGGGEWPAVTAVVAARNEERDIEVALQSLLRLDYEPLEIIVIDDRSTDRTGEILDRLAAENSRLRVIHLTELPPGWLGKNYALDRGAQEASGELLLFTDADCVMEPSVLRRAVAYLLAHRIDHLPMLFRIRMPNWLLESFVVAFSIYLMAFCRPWKCPNPRSDAHIGIGGFNLIRASVYRAIGTHEAIRMRPDDDLKLGKLIKKHGFRQECLNASDLMYVPWYASFRELVRGLEKNAFSGTDYRIGYTALASASILLFNVFPFVALFITRGLTWWLYLIVVLSLLGMALFAAHGGRLRLSCSLGFPLASLLFVGILWRTMLLNLWQGGIQWRDTHYPLAELKANRV